MEQKSNECLNMSPYLWRRTEGISANEPSRIPSNTNHSRAKSIHVSACCNHVLNGLEVFGVIILEGSKKHRKIQVSAEESQVRQPVRVTEARVKNTQMSRLTGLVCPFWHSRLHRRQSATGQFLRSFHCFHRRYLTSRLLARTTDRRACAQDVSNCSTPHTCGACAAM